MCAVVDHLLKLMQCDVLVVLMHISAAQAHRKELDAVLDLSKYVAGGLVVFNAQTRSIKWQLHLDLSTDNNAFRAYIYSNPTLADLNGDGKLEIIVGTSMVSPQSQDLVKADMCSRPENTDDGQQWHASSDCR